MSTEPIISIMDKLNMMHRSLLKLAYHKTEILKTSNVEELSETMKNEQSHIAAISQLEEQRQKLVVQFFQANQIDYKEPTINELLKYVTGEEAVQLDTKRKELLLTIDTLQKQNDLNQKMLFQSLQFVNLTLDLLRPQPDQINYQSKAGGRSAMKTGQFDSQA